MGYTYLTYRMGAYSVAGDCMTGSDVRKLREALGATQERFSGLLGVSIRTMGNIEGSDTIEKHYELAVRALWFGVDVLDIDIL